METISYKKKVLSKKEHRCNFCSEKIRSGESYYISTHKIDGRVYDWKTHSYCEQVAETLKMYENCDEGVTQDDFQGIVFHHYMGLMIDHFPKDGITKYGDIIQQLKYVPFRDKLIYVFKAINNGQDTGTAS